MSSVIYKAQVNTIAVSNIEKALPASYHLPQKDDKVSALRLPKTHTKMPELCLLTTVHIHNLFFLSNKSLKFVNLSDFRNLLVIWGIGQ